jgi:hypothetical protein
MANTFNGIGTTYYGRSKFEQDGSYVTTKWFVIGFFPLLPMASARVNYLGTSGIPFLSRTSSFEVIEEVPVEWLQVLKTWAYTIFIIGLVSGMMTSNKPPVLKIIVIAAGIFLPHMLRFFARKMVMS